MAPFSYWTAVATFCASAPVYMTHALEALMVAGAPKSTMRRRQGSAEIEQGPIAELESSRAGL